VHALPDHRLDLGALVLEREIAMAGGMGAAKARDLAADPDMAIGVLHRPLQGLGELGDGEFEGVVELFRRRHWANDSVGGVETNVKEFRGPAPIPKGPREICRISQLVGWVEPLRNPSLSFSGSRCSRQSVGPQQVHRFGEGKPAIPQEPLSDVTVPLDLKVVVRRNR